MRFSLTLQAGLLGCEAFQVVGKLLDELRRMRLDSCENSLVPLRSQYRDIGFTDTSNPFYLF
ncbi:MAG: hypothetical protein NNA19_10900 [Nitrospira sp.]|nr:hypothetical protein [Nitrospira sp.]MCP9475742.1 hypothetical protein [Nitrospira sp.]